MGSETQAGNSKRLEEKISRTDEYVLDLVNRADSLEHLICTSIICVVQSHREKGNITLRNYRDILGQYAVDCCPGTRNSPC